MTGKKAREFVRSHVLGLIAIFIAVTGTAVASQSKSDGDTPKASASVVTDAKFKKLKQRIVALERRQSPAPPVIPATLPATLPPSGPAGGDLTGSYPSPLIGPDAVGPAEIDDAAVRTEEIATGAVTGGKHFLSSAPTLNFAPVAGEACTSMPVPAGVIVGTDHVIVTPPVGFPATFTLIGVADPPNNQVLMQVCNHFPLGGSVDPDGVGGGTYKVLVIEV